MDTRLKERLVGAVALVLIVVLVVPELLTGPRKAAAPEAPDGAAQVRRVWVELDRSESHAEPPRVVDPAPVPAPAAAPEAPVTAAAPAAADVDAAAPSPPALAVAPAVRGAAASAATPPTTADVAKPAAAPARAEVGKADAPRADAAKPAATRPAVAAPAPKPVVAEAPKAAQAEPPKEALHPPKAPVAAGEGWVVQLGSFASRDNGEKLAKVLRGKGYRAFVSEFRGSGRILYRVRVGPEQDRSRADAIAARLSNDGYKGSVAPH